MTVLLHFLLVTSWYIPFFCRCFFMEKFAIQNCHFFDFPKNRKKADFKRNVWRPSTLFYYIGLKQGPLVNSRKKRFVNPIKIAVTRSDRMETTLGKTPAIFNGNTLLELFTHMGEHSRIELGFFYQRMASTDRFLLCQRVSSHRLWLILVDRV